MSDTEGEATNKATRGRGTIVRDGIWLLYLLLLLPLSFHASHRKKDDISPPLFKISHYGFNAETKQAP